jgi:hypothetical protein
MLDSSRAITSCVSGGGSRCARLRARATEPMPHDALRPEDVVDDESHVGQQRQAEQPAQRRDRLAFLQDDPPAQAQHVRAVADGENLANVRDGEERVPGVDQRFQHEGFRPRRAWCDRASVP